MPLITVSRQEGSLGDELVDLLAQKLGFEPITRDYVMQKWLAKVAGNKELNLLKESPKNYKNMTVNGTTFSGFIEERLRETAARRPVIVRGLGSQIIFRNDPEAVHVRIIASPPVRKMRISARYGVGETQAERLLQLSDKKRRRYIRILYNEDWHNPALYHLCFNTDGIKIDQAVELLIHLLDLHKKSPVSLGRPITSPLPKRTTPPSFAHPSEEEFAKILNLYQIKWEYEPTTFPVEWDAEGNIAKAFAPDFYLPEFDTYIELTTMKQSLVTKKNKKIRRLRELYPNINIKIVYNKDYHVLLERFKPSAKEE